MRYLRQTAGVVVALSAVLLLAMAGVGAAAAEPGDSAGEVDVSLDPANQTVSPGEEAAYDIVVEGATDGIGAYTTTVELGNTGAATITGFEHAHDPMFDNTETYDDRVEVSTAMGDNLIAGADEVTLGTVTVTGDADGETDLIFQNGTDGVTLVNDTDISYDTASVAGGTLAVDVPAVDVSLSPADQTVDVDGQTSYDVVVEGATEGISAYSMTAALGDSSVATVEGFEHTHDPMFDNTKLTADGVNISAAVGAEAIPAGETTVLGTLTVSGESAGVTDLGFDAGTVEVALDDENVSSYATGAVTDGSLEVTDPGQSATLELEPLGPVAVGEFELGVVVDGSENGIEAYDIGITSNSSAVTFTDYELTAEGDSGPLDNSGISAGGTEFSLAAALLSSAHEPAEQTQIATVTVSVAESGAFTLGFGDAAVLNANGDAYALTTADPTLSAESIPPIDGEEPPNDLTGDGLHEDIDGDGQVSIFDVQALFKNIDSTSVQANAPAFDFDGNGGEDVSIFDVQGLFDIVAGGD